MAGNSTISISFKLDGDTKSFKELIKDADGLKAAMNSAVKQSEGLKKSIINWSATVQGISAVSNAVGQLRSTMLDITSESGDFEGAMRKANTMAGLGAKDFEALKDQVNGLSKDVPVLRDQLGNGLYMVISNGVPKDNWIDFLNKSARSSVGGIADLEKVVTVTSTVIKNYGLDWSAAGEIQDKIQMTAKNGVTSFEQLSEALPRVSGNAATLGVGIDELMASFATLTGVSGNTAEVSTQLSAIFSSLIKPSAEAAKTAEAMGIKFDAAAIKAAGGMANFLTQLKQSVSDYSAASGVLEQEVYGRLFGSAEALRALGPLTGELAATYQKNVGAMTDSTGTMDAAFSEMAKGAKANIQLIKNQTAGFRDFISSTFGWTAPFVDFTANAAMTAAAVANLTVTFKGLHVAAKVSTLATKTCSVATAMYHTVANKAAVITRVFSAALRTGAYSATAMKLAIKGLMIASVVGAALAVLTTIIEKLCLKSEEAVDATDKLKDVEESFATAASQAKVSMEEEAQKLRGLIQSKADTTDAINQLNEKYGDELGCHASASQWYDILTQKSELYARQIGLEAQAHLIATKMAENQFNLEMNYAKRRELWKSGKAQETQTVYVQNGMNGGMVAAGSRTTDTDEYADLKASGREYISMQKTLQNMQDELNVKLAANTAELRKGLVIVRKKKDAVEASVKAEEEATAPTGIIEQLEAKLADARKRQAQATTEEAIKAINLEIQTYESKLDEYRELGRKKGEAMNEGMEEAGGLKFNSGASTLAEISNNISILNEQLQTASIQEAATINQSIKLWEKKAEAIRNAGIEEVKSTMTTGSALKKSWSSIKTISGGIEGISAAIKGNGNAWKKTMAIVDGALSVYEGFRAIIGLVSILSSTTKSQTGLEVAGAATKVATTTSNATQSVAQIAANKLETASWMQLAAAETMAAHAAIPFVGTAIASGFITQQTALAITAGIPKFAKGGIAYGPTLGMFGEYAGAHHNPEVVAPLDKLRSLIQPQETSFGKVRFEIEGRTLVGILSRENNIRNRS